LACTARKWWNGCISSKRAAQRAIERARAGEGHTLL